MEAMIARSLSACLDGIEVQTVVVEVDVAAGLPSFTIVGLTDRAIQEARERVKSAVVNSGFSFPARRLIVNLAPAQVRKEGSAFNPLREVKNVLRKIRYIHARKFVPGANDANPRKPLR